MPERETDRGIIRLRIKDVPQLFNSLDPEPFIERDLDDDAVAFIVSWAREVPHHVALRMVVEITEPRPGHIQPSVIADAVNNYFANMAHLARNEFHELMRRGRTSLMIGLLVLAVSMFAAHFAGVALEDRSWGGLVSEGIMIGGWVAMWRPLEILLYDWWPLRRKRLDFERLRDMPVEVKLPDVASASA
jgi:hypothetical protein